MVDSNVTPEIARRSGARSVDRELVVLILLSLVFPPVGLALVGYWLITKGQGPALKPTKTILLMVVAAVIGIAAYIAVITYSGSTGSNSSTANLNPSPETLLKTVKIDGTGAVRGVSFKVPESFQITGGDSKTSALYAFPTKGQTITAVDITTYPVTGTYNKNFQLASVLANPQGKSYSAFYLDNQNYIKSKLQNIFYVTGTPSGINLQADKPQAVAGTSLDSKNAWRINFTATYYPVKDQVPAALQGRTNGQLTFIYHNGAYYYFLTGRQNTNISNQSWASITNSLSINQ
jgi:hypothetical protein